MLGKQRGILGRHSRMLRETKQDAAVAGLTSINLIINKPYHQ